MAIDLEICCECGASVRHGAKFANRIPVLDDYDDRKANGRPYPVGEWVCEECDNKRHTWIVEIPYIHRFTVVADTAAEALAAAHDEGNGTIVSYDDEAATVEGPEV